MAKRTYPGDLTDTECAILEPLLPPSSKVGRPWRHSRRSVINAIFYILRTGSAWRYLPDSFPPWSSVYHHDYRWRRAGVFERWVETKQGVELEVVYPCWRQVKRYMPGEYEELGIDKTFTVLPRRWVVERTFAWLGKQRRFSKDYERPPETSEALIYLGMSHSMLRRIARAARA